LTNPSKPQILYLWGIKMKRTFFIATIPILLLGLSGLFGQTTLVFSGGTKHPMIPIASAILKEAYAKLGITVVVKELPGARSIQSAIDGEVDGELFRAEKAVNEQKNLILIPVVIATAQLVVFTSKPGIKIKTWDDLKPFSIGSQIGIKEVENHTQGMKVELLPDVNNIFKKLLSGRNDVAILPRDVGLQMIKDHNLKGIVMQAIPLQVDNLYHHLNIKHKELVPKITRILQDMEKNGTLAMIRAREENKIFH
jgi:polar amino acid transport system substrate-binding protein